MHRSMLKIDLSVNKNDAVIWDLTPHNSVTCYYPLDYIASKTKNYNLYSHCHENLECHNMNIEHLRMVEVDQRLTGPQTHLRLIINATYTCCCKHYFHLPYMHTSIRNKAFFKSTNAVAFF
jgi:hypothetical protein